MADYKTKVNCEHCNDATRTHVVSGSMDTPESVIRLQADAVLAHRNSIGHAVNTRGNIFSGSPALATKGSEFKHGKEHNN